MLKALQLAHYYDANGVFLCDKNHAFIIKYLIIRYLVKCRNFSFFRTKTNFFQNNAAIWSCLSNKFSMHVAKFLLFYKYLFYICLCVVGEMETS